MEDKKERLGILFGILAAFSVSCMSVFVKLAKEIPNETIIFFRFAIPLIFHGVFYYYKRKEMIHFSYRGFKKHFLRALAGLIAMYLSFYALKKLPLANTLTLTGTMPLFIPFVILIAYKLVVSRRRFIAAIIGFIGIIIVLQPSTGTVEIASFVALLAGFVRACALVSVRHLSKSEPVETILFYFFLISSVVSFFPMVYAWAPVVTFKEWGLLFGVAIFGYAYQKFMTFSYAFAPATKASIPSYLAVVFGGFADWIIWGRVPKLVMFVGIALIIIGGVIAVLDKQAARPLRK